MSTARTKGTPAPGVSSAALEWGVPAVTGAIALAAALATSFELVPAPVGLAVTILGALGLGAERGLGSAAIDLCLVARGCFDGYWERNLGPWDLAAGALIVVEAGGSVTNSRGGRFDPHSGEAVASNGAIHSELITELAKVRT